MVLHPRLLALLGGVTLALALLWGAGVFSPQQAHAQSNDSIPKDYDKRFWEIVKWSKDSSDPARQQASKDALKSAGHKAAPVLNTVGKGLTVIGAGQIWYHNYIQLKPFFNDGTSTTVTMDQETGPAPGTITANFYGRTGQRTGHLILKRFKYAVDASGTATMQWEWIAGISAWEKTNSCGLATGWSYVGYGGSYAVAKATGYTDGSGPVPAFKVSACQKTDTPPVYNQLVTTSQSYPNWASDVNRFHGGAVKAYTVGWEYVDGDPAKGMRVRGTNAFSNNLPTSNGTEVLITPDVYEVNGAERMPVDATPNPNDTTVLDQSTSNKYITDVVTAPELEPFPTAPPAPAPEPPPKVDPATDPDCAGLTAEQCYKLQEQKKKHGAVVWHKENPDGSHTFRFQDGHEWTIFPDGTVFEKFANGVERWTYPDGTTDTYNPGTGERVIKYPDGTTQRKPYPINTPAEEVWNGTAPAPGESTWTAPDGSPMPNPNPAPSPSPSPNPSPQPYPTPPPAQPPTSTPPPTNTQPGCVCDQVTFVGPGIAFEEKFPFSLILYVYEGWKSFAASGTNAPSFSLLPGTKPVSVAGLDGFIKPLRSVMLVVSLMGLCWVMWEAIKKDK